MLAIFRSLVHVLLTISSADALHISEIIQLGAVTNFPGLSTYYRDLREGTLSTSEPPPQPSNMTRRERTKKKICENIFTSHHYRMKSQVWINVDDEAVRSELERDFPEFFRILFVESEIPLEGAYRYDNEYTLRTVKTSNFQIEEYGFSCLATDRLLNNVKEYFVSRAYNVNILSDAPAIAGRFVFTYDDRDQLVLEAMAEESALELPLFRWAGLFEFVYAYARMWDELARNPSDDPVCGLPDGFKLRLCATLYASESLKTRVSFTPTMENVQVECKMKDAVMSKFYWAVYARIDRALFPLLLHDRFTAEWVLTCHARTISTGEPITYYISHGDGPNTIFVYEEMVSSRRPGRLSPWNLLYNVSVAAAGVQKVPSMLDIAKCLLGYIIDRVLP